ncbi:hypothetical protein RHGRI_006280 [Rhododendron griersonianum]|uniref:DUF1087 domain-containing protein n=1 Tax=Rhododendron griersonianum TaxID=479676 RepID=A0AAV6KTY9_9ERIC|nr:hypothetical protein RHGRI_006280 [Rhododendron griersonianum]
MGTCAKVKQRRRNIEFWVRWEKHQTEEEAALGRGKRQRKAVSYREAYAPQLAHAKDSAKASIDTIQMAYPKAKLVLVVAMASDKDHSGFARELLSGMASFFFPYRASCDYLFEACYISCFLLSDSAVYTSLYHSVQIYFTLHHFPNNALMLLLKTIPSISEVMFSEVSLILLPAAVLLGHSEN